MTDDITKLAIQYWGGAGIIIVALTFAVVYLYKRVEKIQEKRLEESKESAEKNAALAKDLSSTLHELSNTVSNLRDVVLMASSGRGG